MVSVDLSASTYRLCLDHNNLLDRPLWMFNSRCMAVFVPLSHLTAGSVFIYLALGFFMLPWWDVLPSAILGIFTLGILLAGILHQMNPTFHWMLGLVLNACALAAFLRFH